MPTRNIIVIGSSSGGMEALTELVKGLPANFPGSLFAVQHVAANSVNYLPEMLDRHTSVTVSLAAEGRQIEPNHLYVAPADHHLLIDSDQMFLSQGPRENRVRPAIDPLFRSAALSHGPRVIGVVLSGALDDGTAGMVAIKNSGGMALVQDPQEAMTPSMPQSVIEHVQVDSILPVAEIGTSLGKLVQQEFSGGDISPVSTELRANLKREVGIMRNESGSIPTVEELGSPAGVSCPDCGGPLWEVDEDYPRFRCHTGHAFTPRHLVAGLQEQEERSLWVALRVMEERARMLKRLAKKDESSGLKHSHELFSSKAVEAEQHVQQIRNLLNSRPESSDST